MATVAGTLSGGWGFNVWREFDTVSRAWKEVRYSPEGAAAAVAGGSIAVRPAFDTGDAAELMNPNATDDDVFLALAKHVPALAGAVGGAAIASDRIVQNVDMNQASEESGVPRPNQWGRSHPTFGSSWLHSDMKDMAFFYVYELYEQLMQKGGLK